MSAVETDVSKRGIQADDVGALAQRALAVFWAIHLLCNNAGVWGGISVPLSSSSVDAACDATG